MNEINQGNDEGCVPTGRLTPRAAIRVGGAGVAALGAFGLMRRVDARGATPAAATPATTSSGTQALPGTAAHAAKIMEIAREGLTKNALNAVILRVNAGGTDIIRAALGESMTGVPATTEMHFRNGAVAISYMATLLLQFVDQRRASLDDKLSKWLPNLPDADRVTLRMLANMTAGYPDYVQNPRTGQELYADPFKQWTTQEQLALSLATPRLFAPGTNWAYAHTNYVILGEALAKIGGKPLATLLQENVLDPLGLTNTQNSTTPAIPEPVLHAFTSERRSALGIPAKTRFYEESTFWNPSWTLAQGAIQTTNIDDMITTAIAIGTGSLLSPASHQAQIAPSLDGFGSALKGCLTCHTLTRGYVYGLGVILNGKWIMQNPLFSGYGAVEAYLPSKKLAIAVATTFGENGFDEQGNNLYGRASQHILVAIAAYLAPNDIPALRS